jgi:hypothetical protein
MAMHEKLYRCLCLCRELDPTQRRSSDGAGVSTFRGNIASGATSSNKRNPQARLDCLQK